MQMLTLHFPDEDNAEGSFCPMMYGVYAGICLSS